MNCIKHRTNSQNAHKHPAIATTSGSETFDREVFVHRNVLVGCEALQKDDRLNYDSVDDDSPRRRSKFFFWSVDKVPNLDTR